MKDTILSVIRLIATPVLLMVLGLILLIHPDSASALVAQILGWVLVIAGVVFAVSAIAGHFDTLGKVLSAVCCFAVGAWLLRNPLMLAAGSGSSGGYPAGRPGHSGHSERQPVSLRHSSRRHYHDSGRGADRSAHDNLPGRYQSVRSAGADRGCRHPG